MAGGHRFIIVLRGTGNDKRVGSLGLSGEPRAEAQALLRDFVVTLTRPAGIVCLVCPRLQLSLRLVRLPSGSLWRPPPRQGSLSEAQYLRFLGEPPKVGSHTIPPGLRLFGAPPCSFSSLRDRGTAEVRRPGLPGESPRAGHRCLSPCRFRASLPRGRLVRNRRLVAAVSLQVLWGR